MVTLASSSLYTSNSPILRSRKLNSHCPSPFPPTPRSVNVSSLHPSLVSITKIPRNRMKSLTRSLIAPAATKGSRNPQSKEEEEEESVPSWAKPDSDEPPPWARDESGQNASQQKFQIPFYVYLVASAVTAIAAVGSVFEYVNQRPVFGVLGSDSIFYAPVLGFFAFTGIPTSAFLWFKSVQAANEDAEEQDRRDGL
ncbi:hypothetical protein U1Q18_039930 [Sarracenia purpurea var. burkii]